MQFFTFTMFDMMVHFLKTFSTDLKKSWHSVFFDTFLFLQKL
jgi:hypothetical protein